MPVLPVARRHCHADEHAVAEHAVAEHAVVEHAVVEHAVARHDHDHALRAAVGCVFVAFLAGLPAISVLMGRPLLRRYCRGINPNDWGFTCTTNPNM